MDQIKILNQIVEKTESISCEYKRVEYYYVYVTFFSDGNFYIGSRVCKTTPETDVNYIGSYKDKEKYQDGEKVIIKTFSIECEMIYCETSLIQEFKNHPKCINVNSTPRVHSKVHKTPNYVNTKDLRDMYGVSSPSTLCNWIFLAGIDRVRIGRSYYIKTDDVSTLDELSEFIKSGNGYENYLKSKGKSSDEVRTMLSKIRGF